MCERIKTYSSRNDFKLSSRSATAIFSTDKLCEKTRHAVPITGKTKSYRKNTFRDAIKAVAYLVWNTYKKKLINQTYLQNFDPFTHPH